MFHLEFRELLKKQGEKPLIKNDDKTQRVIKQVQRTKPEKYPRSEKMRVARPARHGSRGEGVAREVYWRAEQEAAQADIIRRPGKSRERAQDL